MGEVPIPIARDISSPAEVFAEDRLTASHLIGRCMRREAQPRWPSLGGRIDRTA
jgi:hypothetical protein